MSKSAIVVVALLSLTTSTVSDAAGLRVGTAAIELEGDDSMVIAGGIQPRYVQGQEGKLRAVAVVIERSPADRVAIVACDVLMFTRKLADPAAEEIERRCGIPASAVLIHATHTHHAPSTCRVHGYDADAVFCKRVQSAVVQAVESAASELDDATFHFKLGVEKTVGQNSRLLLSDGTIHWGGPRDDAVRPTGPFDPDLPVLAFRDSSDKYLAVIFGHSTHTIGALDPRLRSPAFYGLAAQELEARLGGAVCFLEGASGSTHRRDVTAAEAKERIERAVLQSLDLAEPQQVDNLAALKRPFEFKIRTFDEVAEEEAVSSYCTKRFTRDPEPTVEVFRRMRNELAPHQGESRTTWLQVLKIGPVAVVGVPAEFFTKLGIDIKRRSPFEHTVVAELSNDWIGYLPDREAHRLGGYQVWTGLHSYAAPGTGERMVDQAVQMLEELAGKRP